MIANFTHIEILSAVGVFAVMLVICYYFIFTQYYNDLADVDYRLSKGGITIAEADVERKQIKHGLPWALFLGFWQMLYYFILVVSIIGLVFILFYGYRGRFARPCHFHGWHSYNS